MTAVAPVVRPVLHERGAAVVWTLALVNVLLMVGLLCFAVAAVALARQRASAVADVAALAAAQAPGDRCTAAASSARANGMELASCVEAGPDVTVTVTDEAPAIVQRLMRLLDRPAAPVTATSRAGPPSP